MVALSPPLHWRHSKDSAHFLLRNRRGTLMLPIVLLTYSCRWLLLRIVERDWLSQNSLAVQTAKWGSYTGSIACCNNHFRIIFICLLSDAKWLQSLDIHNTFWSIDKLSFKSAASSLGLSLMSAAVQVVQLSQAYNSEGLSRLPAMLGIGHTGSLYLLGVTFTYTCVLVMQNN